MWNLDLRSDNSRLSLGEKTNKQKKTDVHDTLQRKKEMNILWNEQLLTTTKINDAKNPLTFS